MTKNNDACVLTQSYVKQRKTNLQEIKDLLALPRRLPEGT